jgi:sulfide:quinone oxidoreductase
VRSNTSFGGADDVLKMGRIPYRLKMNYRNLFFLTNGKVPGFGLNIAQLAAEKVF